ncbi:MAG: 4Fe-4S dicluster domain-containing protein [Rikenellaceae bacterium]
MSKYFDQLHFDVRFEEGLVACINCGVCTAVCPAAEFYNYDPRQIVDTVQSRDDNAIEALLKSETIWYCGECMSCRPRCPRGNTPGYVIQALRTLSQRTGHFVESEKGRQQLALKRVIGQGILDTGYCLTPRAIDPDLHPEQGPVWRWVYDNHEDVYALFTDNYASEGAGPVRKISPKTMDELHSILEQTGCIELFDAIEEHSERKAKELGFEGADDQYLEHVFTTNSGNHQ